MIVEARRLAFAFGTTVVVSDVSLTLPHGAIGALIGANGSGKSTLIRLLAGLLMPASGDVFLDRVSLSSLSLRERAKRIAYVPQSMQAVFPFTALEVVLTGRSPYSGRFSFENSEDERVAFAALELLDATHLAHRPITEMSGGEQQMVTVARALAQEPDVLLLDEPASALDLKHRMQLARALRRLSDQRGVAALMVTHDLMFLDSVADFVFAMKCGRIVSMGQPESVLVEEVLTDVYDAAVRAERRHGRTFTWSELSP
ncbi:MAG TPA: ABC transporter ATP-binding protein [Pyrinomonadaceae bacterium]|nr:ABC transporter ATP-binding protein [Pyrinomonadaceae bacterium]